MTDAYIYDAVRTPRGKGKKDGSLHEVTPIRLAAQALTWIRDRNDLDTAEVDDIVLGVVEPVGEQGADIARVAALHADYDESVSGVQINRFCASGLEAVNMAAGQVMSGQSDLSIGGGVESMSRVPMFSGGGAWMADPEVAFKTYFVPQGVSADLVATKYGFSRDDVDAYAVESQRRAKAAWDAGYFEGSVVPVTDQNGLTVLDYDEYMRPQTTMQSLASLDPSFKDQGENCGFAGVAIRRYPEVERIAHVHRAGNSSGIVDGGAAVLVGNKEIGDKLGLKARARIRAFSSIGSEPTIMLTGPSAAAEKALKRAGMTPEDIDLYELNEAFAAQALVVNKEMGWDTDKVNVNGGAIALGHPIGASGTRVLITLLHEMGKRDAKKGIAALCIGGGMGIAMCVERD